jgi:septal ring factor EnvC (AmiA/AmiB activator)
MKITHLALAAIATVLTVASCNSEKEKVDEATSQAVEAGDDLKQAKDDYLLEVEKYKIETADKIIENDKRIADLNASIKTEKKETREQFIKDIAALEAKNADLKMQIEVYKADSKENWDKFKIEFSHDMDELGKAFKDLTVKNVK